MCVSISVMLKDIVLAKFFEPGGFVRNAHAPLHVHYIAHAHTHCSGGNHWITGNVVRVNNTRKVMLLINSAENNCYLQLN